MAGLVVNQGLQRIGINASQASGFATARHIRTMSVDDSTTALVAGHTAANSGGAVTNFYDQALDGTPTRTNQTIRHVMTVPTGQGNFTIRRILLHDDTAANVTASSATLVAGIDGQSLGKTSDFTLAITIDITYTNVE